MTRHLTRRRDAPAGRPSSRQARQARLGAALLLTSTLLAPGAGREASAQEAHDTAPARADGARDAAQDAAQDAAPAPEADAQAALRQERLRFYEEAKLSHQRALLYTALMPGLGNVYAKRTFSGVLLMGLYTMSWMTLAYGFAQDQPDMVVTGAAVALGCLGAGLWMSASGVSDYNEALRVRYQLQPIHGAQTGFGPLARPRSWSGVGSGEPMSRGITLHLSVSF